MKLTNNTKRIAIFAELIILLLIGTKAQGDEKTKFSQAKAGKGSGSSYYSGSSSSDKCIVSGCTNHK